MLKDYNTYPDGLERYLRDHIAWLTKRAWQERRFYHAYKSNPYSRERHLAKYSEQRLQIQWLRDLVAEQVTA